jgi:CBS domain-containing protein
MERHMATEIAIGDVMTPSPVSVGLKEKLLAARELMTVKGIRHLPIVEDNQPVSVISDRDITLAILANKHSEEDIEKLTVEDVCSLDLYHVELDTSLSEVAKHMAENALGSVVITRDGVLDGIFTATDACKYLSMCLQGQFSNCD